MLKYRNGAILKVREETERVGERQKNQDRMILKSQINKDSLPREPLWSAVSNVAG